MRPFVLVGLGMVAGLIGLWWAGGEARWAEAELVAAESWAAENRRHSETLLELEAAVGKLEFVVQGESDRRKLTEQIRGVQQSAGVSFAAKPSELGQRRGNDSSVVKQVISGCQVEGPLEVVVATFEALERSGPFWLRVGKVTANATTGGQVVGQSERVAWTFDLEYLEMKGP
ncbi:MAG: hypothetical protein Q8M16_02830 [Pirellulaceae bacterium]|nr:hypothetical protein [Pirellulaceae bacterium]